MEVDTMSVTFQTDDAGVDWQQVTDLLGHFGLVNRPAADVETAFRNSYAVVFVKDEAGNTVGCGRAISDGVMQAAVFNIALEERYHGRGLGKAIMKALADQLKGMVITLYTHPKTLQWYLELGFSKQNTGLVRYRDENLERMKEMGFIDDFHRNAGIFTD